MSLTTTLHVGAAARDITPPLGTHLGGSGMGEHRPARSVADPLYVKAIAFDDGKRRFAIIAFDLIIIGGECTQALRRQAQERLGLPPEALMVHCIQTHSAPGLGKFMLDPDFPLQAKPELEYLWGSETTYCDFAMAKALEALSQALGNLQPAEIATANASRPDLTFNRRGEETIDPDVALCAIRNQRSRRMIALLLHYTSHPVNLFCKGWKDPESFQAISADWPGVWATAMQQACGSDCVPLVLVGSCGNSNPGPYTDAWDRDHLRQGGELAQTTRGLLEGLVYRPVESIGYAQRMLELDYRQVPTARLAEVEAILSVHPEPTWKDPQTIDPQWFHAASTRSIEYCRRRHPRFPYELQALRVGDVAIVGLPGEPFAEGQLDLKRRSPATQTIVVHMVSHYVGYLPTREAYPRLGHEANELCTYWAKLAPGSLETIVGESLSMLGDLFRQA